MTQLALAVGLVVFPVTGIALAIGPKQHAKAVHFAIGPLAFEAVADVGSENAFAVEAAFHCLTAIAPALSPAADHMAVGDQPMLEKCGEALRLAVMSEGGRAQAFAIALGAGAGPAHRVAR